MKVFSRAKLAQVFVACLEYYPLPELTKAFAVLLRQQGRLRQLEYLLADINQQLLRQKGHLVAEVTSAHHLSAATLKELKSFLGKQSGAQTVETPVKVDPALGGGIIAVTPFGTINWSIKHRLNLLRQS